MATFQQSIEVGTLDGSRSKELKAWVDTGTAYTWIPRQFWKNLASPQHFVAALGWQMAPKSSVIALRLV